MRAWRLATVAASLIGTAAAPPTGDQRPTYRLAGAAAPLAYRLYVPADWRAGDHWPLVLILHGFGGAADRPFEQGGAELRAAADRLHFILVAPSGYDGKGDWGANLPLPPGASAATATLRSPQQVRLAEADAMAVFRRVSRAYATDPARAFVIGNSMGMTGTLHLAVKYPSLWCAIGPSGGPPWLDYPVDRLKVKGAFLANGEADTIAPIADTRALADRLRAAGVDTRFMGVPGGVHSTAWVSAIPAMFDFFASLRCR